MSKQLIKDIMARKNAMETHPLEKILKKIHREMVISNMPDELKKVQREYFSNYDNQVLHEMIAKRSDMESNQYFTNDAKADEYHAKCLQNIKDGAVSA